MEKIIGHLIISLYNHRLLTWTVLGGSSLLFFVEGIKLWWCNGVTIDTLLFLSPIIIQSVLNFVPAYTAGSGQFATTITWLPLIYAVDPYYFTIDRREPEGEVVHRSQIDYIRRVKRSKRSVYVNGKFKIN